MTIDLQVFLSTAFPSAVITYLMLNRHQLYRYTQRTLPRGGVINLVSLNMPRIGLLLLAIVVLVVALWRL